MHKNYNDRLFFGLKFRSWLHSARFLWLKKIIQKYNINYSSVIELGCYDGKSINYLPQTPKNYVGYDANWEGGLDIFKQLWKNHPHYQAYNCSNLSQFNFHQKKYDLTLCMETLEHLPRKELSAYIEKLINSCNKYFIITIPNEIGILFIIKYIFKLAFHYLNKETTQTYTPIEFIYQSLGMTNKVEQHDHKGFNYKKLINELNNFTEIIEVQGIQFPHLPLFTNPSIGILCKKI